MMSFRRHSVAECLSKAESGEIENYIFLHYELRLNEPQDAIILKFIEKMPESIRTENSSGSNAFHVAASNASNVKPGVMKALLAAYPEGLHKTNSFGLLPIHKACMNGNKDSLPLIEMLVRLYPGGLEHVNIDGQLPLHLALSVPKYPCFEIIQLLLKNCDKAASFSDKNGQTPLHKIVSKRRADISIVELLLDVCPDSACIKDIYGSVQ